MRGRLCVDCEDERWIAHRYPTAKLVTAQGTEYLRFQCPCQDSKCGCLLKPNVAIYPLRAF